MENKNSVVFQEILKLQKEAGYYRKVFLEQRTMVRTYKRKSGSRPYRNYTEEQVQEAVNKVKRKQMSVKKAAETYKIPRKTLENKVKGKHEKKHGHPTLFSKIEEELFCKALIKVQEWGFPFELIDFRFLVKSYLDKSGRKCPMFKNNFPGIDFCKSFIKRNKVLTNRTANNMKRTRATVTPEDLDIYFENLSTTLDDIPPCNIFNYDESNLSDDPGRKRVLAKRGSKYIDRIVNTTKSSHSIMMCGSADGNLLPVYTVYKSVELWDTWCVGGPKGEPFCQERCCTGGARFNRSKSGWFEARTFNDWFFSSFLPHSKRLNGRKVLIGDNLSSHFTSEILQSCEENDIAFVCLPPNSTHICQPLDVSFFAPLKRSWRKILSDWKLQNHRSTVVPKSEFPCLLEKLFNDMKHKSEENLKSGFRTCGIYPLNKDMVLSKLPQSNDNQAAEILSSSVTELLKEMRYDKQNKKLGIKRKLLNVEPGKSISTADVGNDCNDDQNVTSKKKAKKSKSKFLQKRKGECTSTKTTERTKEKIINELMPIETPTSSVRVEDNDSSSERGDSHQPEQAETEMQDCIGVTSHLKKINNLSELRINTIVAVVYEQKWWLGKVTELSDEHNDACVHFMVPSGPTQHYQWGGVSEKHAGYQLNILLA